MKCCQTISIEQKYGKYLFDKKIKTKKILTKQISIQTKEEDIKKDLESQLKEANEEKKKFIQIIQSFEDPLSQDNINLENISFFSDIKTPDSELTIQLKEELPKIRDDSIKSDFIYNIHKDINLMDLKNNYFIEPLLNNFKFNRKNVKIINNENKKNSNKNEEENKDEKEETKEEQNEKEDDHKEKDDIEAKIKRKNIIIKSLIYFNRDITADGIENFKKRTPDYNKSKYEEDNKLEKNIYIKIEDRIREILNKSKSDKLSLLREFENNYLLRITNFEKKSENYKYLCIKGIIIGLINIINDWAGKEYLKCTDEKKDYENGDIFIVIFEKYEILKKICSYLEKDFKSFIDNFKESNKLEFNLIDLFSDIFWDYIFRIREINIFFTNNYNNDKINEKLNEVMENIINILININLPYKKLFGEILNMNCIKQEKIYLMNYINKYKKSLIKSNNNNENNENKLHNSSSSDKILNKNLNEIEKEENKNENIEEEEKDNNKNVNISNENINNSNDDCNNISNSISNDTNEKEIDLSLGKSLSMDASSNKLTDKDSLEKVYNYILYGESESSKKKQKRKHKKKKKNKKNIVSEDENTEDTIDPVVEEYKNYINDLNKNCTQNYRKIKPKIKEEWINYISTSVDE